jgi:hypothetical protein
MTPKYTKWPIKYKNTLNCFKIPNDHKRYKNPPFESLQKDTKIAQPRFFCWELNINFIYFFLISDVPAAGN